MITDAHMRMMKTYGVNRKGSIILTMSMTLLYSYCDYSSICYHDGKRQWVTTQNDSSARFLYVCCGAWELQTTLLKDRIA